jgi:hypothetical protein
VVHCGSDSLERSVGEIAVAAADKKPKIVKMNMNRDGNGLERIALVLWKFVLVSP